MSRLIPEGAVIMATLFRPMPDVPCPGAQTWHAHGPIGAADLVSHLVADRAALLEPLPLLVRPGAPISVLIHVLHAGRTFVQHASFSIERAITLPDFDDAFCAGAPHMVAALFSRLPSFAPTPLDGTPLRNAPTTETPQ